MCTVPFCQLKEWFNHHAIVIQVSALDAFRRSAEEELPDSSRKLPRFLMKSRKSVGNLIVPGIVRESQAIPGITLLCFLKACGAL